MGRLFVGQRILLSNHPSAECPVSGRAALGPMAAVHGGREKQMVEDD